MPPIEEADMTLTNADARRAGYCVDGVRKWFASYGLDYRAFCRGEMTAAEIRTAVGQNAMLDRVIEFARLRLGETGVGG